MRNNLYANLITSNAMFIDPRSTYDSYQDIGVTQPGKNIVDGVRSSRTNFIENPG
jgi:hypothetical protein